jgi:hypothetical protein
LTLRDVVNGPGVRRKGSPVSEAAGLRTVEWFIGRVSSIDVCRLKAARSFDERVERVILQATRR